MSAAAAPSAASGAAVAPLRATRLLLLPTTRRLWIRSRSSGWSAALAPVRSFATADGPSCIFVGPLETASQEMLEALYHQARDSYYSGEPLIIDDMFDKVELKLRFYGSKSVVKYPRCSLSRQLTYADAEEDPSQVFALASIWTLFLAFGGFAFLIPTIYSISLLYNDITSSIFARNSRSPMEWLTMLNGVLFMGFGYLIGCPISSASVKALKGLWKKELVALKGSCPNCGEETNDLTELTVMYVRADWNSAPKLWNLHQSPKEVGSMVESTLFHGDPIIGSDASLSSLHHIQLYRNVFSFFVLIMF